MKIVCHQRTMNQRKEGYITVMQCHGKRFRDSKIASTVSAIESY